MLVIVVCLLLGFMGPFGTYAMPTGIRLIYWVVFGFIGYLIFRPISFVADWLSEISSIPGWLSIVMATGVAAFPLTILIAIAIGGMQVADNPMLLDNFGLLYLQVSGIGIGIFLIMRLVFGPERVPDAPDSAALAAAPAAEGLPAPRCRLHNRLPPSFTKPIAALGVEDHYVRVFGSDGGSEMLLMRLSDAMAEMDGVEGLQIHRSWWVARHAVESGQRDGRNVTLLLSGGLRIPVSRSNVARVRQAGLLS